MSKELEKHRNTVGNCKVISIKAAKTAFKTPCTPLETTLERNNLPETPVTLYYVPSEKVIIIAYENNDQKWHMDLNIIEKPATFGNYRYFFLCSKCKKMVQKLYLPVTSNIWTCRECHRLVY